MSANIDENIQYWKGNIKDYIFFALWTALKIIIKFLGEKKTLQYSSPFIVIYPPDPEDVFGSLGDDAMIEAIATLIDKNIGDASLKFLVKGAFAEQQIVDRGYEAISVCSPTKFLFQIAGLARNASMLGFVGVGADVMDGKYSLTLSKTMLVGADISTRFDRIGMITGFSFNQSPKKELKKYFNNLHDDVIINVRDPISRRRLDIFSNCKSRLVSDLAFSLRPNDCLIRETHWIHKMKAEGLKVIGLNIHANIFVGDEINQVDRVLDLIAGACERLRCRDQIAWLLTPHDYREGNTGDDFCLRPLYAKMQRADHVLCHYHEGRHRSASLKALASHLDGVVTARMHFGIAALGTGTPMLGIAYQGKFSGLFDLFNLPKDFLMNPVDLFNQDFIISKLDEFVENLPALRNMINKELGNVMAMSSQNLAEFGGLGQR